MDRTVFFSRAFILCSLAVLLLATSCKKDKQEQIATTVQGGWRNVTNSQAEPAYYLLTADRKLYRMSYSDKYKKTEFGIYKATESQITIQDNNGTRLYNYRFAGDTLFFNDGTKDVVKLLKDNLAPKAISDWTGIVTPTDRFSDTAEAKTIAWYNNSLYTFKYYSVGSKLLTYNTASKTVSLSDADNAYYGVDFAADGTMWCVLWGNAYKFNPVTGVNTFKSTDLSSNSVWATAVNGSLLYNYASGKFMNYSIADNDWFPGKDVDTDVTDLAYANGFLYVAKGGMVYKMHPYYAIPVQTWYLENYDIKGIAFTGTDFWLSAKDNVTDKHEMIRAALN